MQMFGFVRIWLDNKTGYALQINSQIVIPSVVFGARNLSFGQYKIPR
jgi:hypothetical protein